ELSVLKRECVIINVARGRIIQQKPLIQALREGCIRGAALDVFEQEPLPPDSPLFDLPNVFITPHVAGVAGAEHWPRMIALLEENLTAFLAGKPLRNQVDIEKGY